MAQLTDDCFAFDGGLLTVADALARLHAILVPIVEREQVETRHALNRVLAEVITPRQPIPPYDNSAVDGFAVYHADLSSTAETILPVIGRVAAGAPLDGPQIRGTAVKIFTGAPMPDGPDGVGPDTVMMLEDCVISEDGTHVAMKPGIKHGANRRNAGEDVAADQEILRPGTRLRPPELGMAAACGRDRITVFKPLRVALFSTGDEVLAPGARPRPGALYDSNRFTIGAALAAIGCEVTDLGILPDDPGTIQNSLEQAAKTHGAILSTGGMSMGEEDHVRASVEALGSLDFWRVAIKPGRPIGMGLIPSGSDGHAIVIGLPGNPVAALTTFVVLARPVLQALAGVTVTEPARAHVVSGFSYKKKSGRREFVRGRLDGLESHGIPRVVKHGLGGAGILSSLVGADGFVELDEDVTHINEGSPVKFLSFAEVFR